MLFVRPRPARVRFAAMLAPAALSLVTVTFRDAKDRAKAFAVFGRSPAAGPRSACCSAAC